MVYSSNTGIEEGPTLRLFTNGIFNIHQIIQWIGQGTIDREINVPNLFYYSNFSYCCTPMWSCGGWQSEVAVHGSAPAPVWPFRFTMDGQSTPVWLLSGGHEGLSGVSGRQPALTNNPDFVSNYFLVYASKSPTEQYFAILGNTTIMIFKHPYLTHMKFKFGYL